MENNGLISLILILIYRHPFSFRYDWFLASMNVLILEINKDSANIFVHFLTNSKQKKLKIRSKIS